MEDALALITTELLARWLGVEGRIYHVGHERGDITISFLDARASWVSGCSGSPRDPTALYIRVSDLVGHVERHLAK